MSTATAKAKGGLHYMVAAAFFFSLMSMCVKLAGQRLPTTEIVMARSVVMLVISSMLVRRAGISPWGNRKGLLVTRGLVGFSALLGFFFAVTRLPLADVTVIHFTNPVFTALFASLFLHESMRRKEIAGLALSIIGVSLVARPSFLFGRWAGDLEMLAVGVAMTASVLSATAYVTIRKLKETEHYLVIVFYFSMVSTAASVPLAAGSLMWPTPSEWALLIGIGVATQTAQIFLTKGLLRERAGRAMSVSYVQVLFAAMWGMIVFGDQPGLLSVGGAALVFLGALLVARKL
jgi:drug/metabolite transporter (DMT)-like permease